MLDFLSRKVRLAKALLARPYTMHPLRNAFDGIPFGSNTHGVFAATTDDHLHSTEAGLMLSLSQVAYQGLTPKESQEFGQIIRRTLSGCRSSVWSDYSFLQ